MTDKGKPTATRLPEPMVERLREVAERNDRTVSAEMRRAIKAHLAAYDEGKAGKGGDSCEK